MSTAYPARVSLTVSFARELDGHRAFELAVLLGAPPDPQQAPETLPAVQRYFATRAQLKHREFRLLLRRGHTVLAGGGLFPAPCLFLSGFATRLFPTPTEAVGPGESGAARA